MVYKDLHWTGKISTAFFEILTLDPLTRLATKSGERTVCVTIWYLFICMISWTDLAAIGYLAGQEQSGNYFKDRLARYLIYPRIRKLNPSFLWRRSGRVYQKVLSPSVTPDVLIKWRNIWKISTKIRVLRTTVPLLTSCPIPHSQAWVSWTVSLVFGISWTGEPVLVRSIRLSTLNGTSAWVGIKHIGMFSSA